MRNKNYVTKQKELLINIIKNIDGEFTIKDIYSRVNGKVGLTTIYRLVDSLVKKGIINKSIGRDNNTYYQYLESCNEENHFYLKCDKCGKMTHVDCDCIGELSNHIKKHHNFKLKSEHIIINGVCSNCNK